MQYGLSSVLLGEKCMYSRDDGEERGTERAEVGTVEHRSSASVKPKVLLLNQH